MNSIKISDRNRCDPERSLVDSAKSLLIERCNGKTIQGNIKALPSVQEPLQLGMDNGARKTCIPIENKRHFLDVPADIVEQVEPIFYSEPTCLRSAQADGGGAFKCLE